MYAASLSLLIGLSSCVDDWGQSDPPAGTDKYPKLEQVATFDFEEDIDPQQIQLAAYSDGNVPELVDDEELGSKVLHLNGGYAKLFNPFGSYQLQEAASMTFLVKQQSEGALIVDEEGNAVLDEDGNEQREAFSKDLSSALVCFQNANATQSLYITPNGGLVYDGIDGELTVNDASDVTTGLLDELGEWHYVALSVSNTGYTIYVDGNKRVDQTVTDFDCSKIVQFISDASFAYVGYGANDHCNDLWVDDLKFYRNSLTSKQTADPRKPSGADSEFEYIIGSFVSTVGATDCSAAWWTEFSNYFRMPSTSTMKFRFVNHTNKVANWDNWVFYATSDADRGSCTEYAALRADCAGWGNNYNGTWSLENFPGAGDDDGWAQWREDMDGATVEVVATRVEDKLTMEATTTCLNGTVYKESYTSTLSDGSEVIRIFFVVEGAYIEFESVEVLSDAGIVSDTVGASDCSDAFWTVWSDYYKIPAGCSLHLDFINHTLGAGNYQNWDLGITTDADRADTANGYAEYLILRADCWGWGNSYPGQGWVLTNYPSNDDEWGDFRINMEGAHVVIDIVRDGANVTVTAVNSCTNGVVYTESITAECGDASEVLRAFFIVDGSYLELNASECYLSKRLN
jgi:hypothetical protein